MLIDTHCHLDFPQFAPDRQAIVASAAQRGVAAIVVPAITAAHLSRVLDCCLDPASQVSLYPALGLHPCFMEEHTATSLEVLKQKVQQWRNSLVAIGEIGLDFRQASQEQQARQIALLEAQLKLAKEVSLPVLLHAVKAHDQVLKQLRKVGLSRGGIVHAFSGSEQQAQEYIKLGFKLGFGGAISYTRATKLRRLVSQLPLETFVLETDSPDMPLAAWRDQPNEPQRVADICEIIAQLRGVTAEEIASATGANARQLLAL